MKDKKFENLKSKYPLGKCSTHSERKGTYTIKTHNRFEVLANLENDSSNDTFHGSQVATKGSRTKRAESYFHADQNTAFKSVVRSSVQGDIDFVERNVKPGPQLAGNQAVCNVSSSNGGTNSNSVKGIEYTDTNFIVKATFEGKKYVKKVNVQKLDKKCDDLQKCLKQQSTALGFLPITQLAKAKHAMSQNKHDCHRQRLRPS